MARPFIELYINNQLVEFDEPPRVLMTYAHNELHNPTVVKNSYSKTLDIAGTPNNNKIFNAFYDMRWVNGAGFNPSKKMSFELYRNGEIMEQGYAKLDSVKRTNNNITYSITLYGGLGQFLYNLTIKEDGEQMKLKDLIYPYDLNFEVNKDTVWDAWQHINNIDSPVMPLSDELNVYDFINFAPCYNGIPKDFTANKVAINAEMFLDDYKATLDLSKDGYTTVNGWIMGELQDNLDEWKTKDLRSYLQRPVIRVKEIIKACCDPQNNGGYEVELDNDFFNADNKYWNDAWMTLPLLTELEDVVDATENDYSIEIGENIIISNMDEGRNFNITVPALIKCTAESSANSLQTTFYRSSWDGSDESAVVDEYTNFARYIQLVAYNANDEVIGGSSIFSFYSSDVYSVFEYEPVYEASISRALGYYIKQDDGTYVFNNKSYDFTIKHLEYQEGMYFKFVEKFSYYSSPTMNYPNHFILYTGDYSKVDVIGYQTGIIDTVKIELNKGLYWFITQDTMLNSEHTPCDYFLSYLKMFNLHIWKDMYENKIYVSKRNNFFTNEFYDLEDVIDRGNEISITPLTFDAKWYNFKLDMETSGALYKDYKNEYGIEYGIQKVDTNYNFDNSSKDLFNGNAYKGCIMQRGRSRYYIDLFDERYGSRPMPAYIQDGIQTFLYNSSGDTTEGTYLTPKTTLNTSAWGYGRNYDITPKASFVDNKNEPIEGANCLLFYDGYKELKDENGKYLWYNLTDDIPEFEILNEGEPCWIWTSSYYSIEGDKIALNVSNLPIFSRYSTNNNSWVIHSWDFGTPKALYVEDYNIDETSSIYSQYWQPYIQDMYSVDTRTVDCKVLLKERVIGDWLRRWYYFDGTYWMLNEITDYDVTSNDTTKCKFVRIMDTQNYLL